MTLAERLASDQRKATLAGDSLRVSTIRLARASIQNAAIERGRDLTDAEVVEGLGREVRRRGEPSEEVSKGGPGDVAAAATLERAVRAEYGAGPASPAEPREPYAAATLQGRANVV